MSELQPLQWMRAIDQNFSLTFQKNLKPISMKEISTKKAPVAIGPYSQAIQVGGLVYTSGQLPINPETGALVEIEVVAESSFLR